MNKERVFFMRILQIKIYLLLNNLEYKNEACNITE